MPYYSEEYVNSSVKTLVATNGVTQYSGDLVLDSTKLMTHRSSPKPDAINVVEMSDLSVDPYAYFLESTSERKYHERLKERGLPAQGDADRGHPFELVKHTLVGPLYDVTRTSNVGGNKSFYQKALVLPLPSDANSLDTIHRGTLFKPAPYRESGLDAFAQQAYSRTAPTGVVFDAAVFLGELREGLPRLVPELLKNSSRTLRNAGSDYLNVEFGWKPLIADLQNAGKALLGATELLRNQGERVHRRYSLPSTRTFATVDYDRSVSIMAGNWTGVLTSPLPGNETGFGSSSTAELTGRATYTKSRTSTRWFEGEFSSFYPLGFDPSDYLHRLSVLVNPKITPSTLWELAPWSWLVDWNLRIGDTIRANELNANDLLVMHYGYAMEHSVYSTILDWRTVAASTPTASFVNRPNKAAYYARTEYKRRLRANPYGFRVGGAGALTGNQAAILGALGLTKLR